MLAIAMHEFQWKKFEREINGLKRHLIREIRNRDGVQLELADAEIHSVDIRIPKNRRKHPFLGRLTDQEVQELVDLFYSQLSERHITIMAVVVDKARLRDHMDREKVTKKVYELLLERGERFIGNNHPKQNGIFVLDNTTKALNRSVAMKHSHFQLTQTTAGVRLNHIIELPFFVESYLSNGVQLADLCAYNVYRAFRMGDAHYPFFKKLIPFLYCSDRTTDDKIDGLKVFPDDHRWEKILVETQEERARMLSSSSGLRK